MKFDYYNRNININHQISHHNINKQNVNYIRPSKIVQFKKIYNKMMVFGLILIELLIILLGISYYLSPLNRISKVSVNGNHTIMRQSIISDMKSNPGNSVIYILDHQIHLKEIMFHKNAQLKSINIRVHHWNFVNIKVKEYPVIAYLKRGHQFFAISNNGEPDHQATSPNQSNPILCNFKLNQRLISFVKSYKRIPASVKPDIQKIYYVPTKVDPDRIRINMNDGNLVYANFGNWARKMKYYSAISKSMKKNGVVNLELGAYSKIFRKSDRK